MIRDPGEVKVSDLNSAGGVGCGFQIAMDDVSLMQVQETIEQLVYRGLGSIHGDWRSKPLGVMVNDLLGEVRISRFDLLVNKNVLTRKSCLACSKNHIDRFVLKETSFMATTFSWLISLFNRVRSQDAVVLRGNKDAQ